MGNKKQDKAGSLSREQRALLLKKIRAGKTETALYSQEICRRPEGCVDLASYAQDRIWFLDHFISNKQAYYISRVYLVKGMISKEVLEESISAVAGRHNIFRTVYLEENGKIVVHYHNNQPYLFTFRDISGDEETEIEEQCKTCVMEETEKHFDLRKGPLLRILLIRKAPNSHVLVITMHHIISDGWSVNIFLQELADTYEQISSNSRRAYDPPPVQYADYVYHRRNLEKHVNEGQLLKLKNILSGHDYHMDLAFGRQRPGTQSYQGSILKFSMDKNLSRKLRDLAKQEHMTLFMLLYSVYHLLLAEYTGNDDLVIAIPVANREEQEVETMMGLFVNTLPVRFCHNSDEIVCDMLARLKSAVLECFSCRQVPFDHLLDALDVERDLSMPPLCQAMFVLQNTPAPTVQINGICFEPVIIHNHSAKLDLTLEMYEDAEELYGWFEYNTDILSQEMVEQMRDSFITLAGEMVRKQGGLVKSLNLLSSNQEVLLDSYNTTGQNYEPLFCLHEYIQFQGERAPGNPAVIFEGKSISYLELNQRANRVARHLRSVGIGPEKMVGVCMERSVELVVGLLAILKAGGAYVPIDPEFPQERISYMLSDSGADVILTQQRHSHKLVGFQGKHIIMDMETGLFAGYSCENLQTVNCLDHMAYVIYTSGTTGTPKGVVNQHDGIVNRLLWMQEAYGLEESDRVLQKTPYSFDVSVWEFFWPLMIGAAIVMAKPQGHKDANYLIGLIEQERVTTIHFVPSMLNVFLDVVRPGSCPTLKRIICSGEALPYAVKEACNATFTANLYNLYGPTEAAVDVTSWDCKQERSDKIVPIGKPISNIRLYIIDQQMRRVPPGVIGELCISGVGVARGYWNKEELTNEKFVEVRFGEKNKTRIYKTGDMARYLSDGNIEYIGRTDHQVKIRGFRIELSEIESVINRISEIHQSIVVAKQYQGNTRLVAYLLKKDQALINESQICDYLRQYLPGYMMPSFFIFIDKVPLNHNGKLALDQLPEPFITAAVEKKEYMAPHTVKEKIIADIWADILHLDKISAADNFFEVGGDSLLAIQVVSRAQKAGLLLSTRQIFEAKTLAELASASKEEEISKIEIKMGEVITLTPIQSWFFAQNFESKDYYNQTMLLKLPDNVDISNLEQAIRKVILRHEALRMEFKQGESGWFQQLLPADELTVELKRIDLMTVENKEEKLIGETRNINLSLNVEVGKLVGCLFVDWGPEEKILFIAIHHLVVDAVSWHVIIHELNEAYLQLEEHKEIVFPSQSSSFYQWVKRLEQYAGSEELKKEIFFWRQQIMEPALSITNNKIGQDKSKAIALQQSHIFRLDAKMTELLIN